MVVRSLDRGTTRRACARRWRACCQGSSERAYMTEIGNVVFSVEKIDQLKAEIERL